MMAMAISAPVSVFILLRFLSPDGETRLILLRVGKEAGRTAKVVESGDVRFCAARFRI
jgi:hypothetical protein